MLLGFLLPDRVNPGKEKLQKLKMEEYIGTDVIVDSVSFSCECRASLGRERATGYHTRTGGKSTRFTRR